MSVKFQGVELVPVEGWVVRAFHTLMTKDELVRFKYWRDNHGERWEYDGQPRDVPILQPDQHGESGEYRMFLADTDEGRKIVLYWSGMTVPVIDWSVNDGHLDDYLETLRAAAEELESDALRRSYRTQRKYETNAELIRKWADLLDHAREFRNTLIGWKYLPEEGQLVPDDEGHVFVDDPDMPYGLAYKNPDLDYFHGQNDVHEVGGAFYFRDVKVFRSNTPPAEAIRLSQWCQKQSELALQKYLVTGDSKDYERFLERGLKAKLNKLVGVVMAKNARSSNNGLKAAFLSRLGMEQGALADRVWGVASRRAYLDHHRRTGEWKTPDSVDDLMRHTGLKGLVFDHLLHTTGGQLFGVRLTTEFRRLRELCSVSKPVKKEFGHQKLLKFLPVPEVDFGAFYYRDKKSAWAHWVSKDTWSTQEAPLAIPRPEAPKKVTLGMTSLLDI